MHTSGPNSPTRATTVRPSTQTNRDAVTTPPRPRKANQADVARLAGVSTAVVSYVVNNGPRPVSAEARERVLSAIETLGYKPNASARTLRSGRSRLLGVAVPEVSNPYQAEFVEHITAHARAQGLSTLLVSTGNTPQIEKRTLSSFRERGIEGLIVSSLNDPHLYSEFASLIPTTILNAEEPVAQCASVSPDFRPAVRDAVGHLADHGHSRISLILGPLEPWGRSSREQGWHQEMEARALSAPLSRARTWTRRGGYEAMVRLLDDPQPPTAVIAGSDLLAIGALRAMADRGMTTPDDIAIITLDGTDEALFAQPQLTCMTQPIDVMARAAVATITTPSRRQSVHLFPLSLRIGASCGCPPSARTDPFTLSTPRS